MLRQTCKHVDGADMLQAGMHLPAWMRRKNKDASFWAYRLALAMANCHLKMLGQKTHTCSADVPLQECTGSFPDDRSYNTYNEQLAQIGRCITAALTFVHVSQLSCL